MGGRATPPSTSTFTRLSKGAACSCRRALSILSPSARVLIRTSRTQVHSAASTLAAVPPFTRPIFTVVPASGLAKAIIFSPQRINSLMALAPLSGFTPAWEAIPWKVSRYLAMPFRSLTRSPLGRADSIISAWSAFWASRSIIGRENRELISSSGLNSRQTLPLAFSALSSSARYTMNRSPHFISEAPGPLNLSPSVENGRWAAVPGGNTVSIWPKRITS